MPEKLTYIKYNEYDNNTKQLYSYLKSSTDLSPIAIAGILGNFIHETTGGSGINPNAQNSKDGGYGFAQWTFSRRDNLINFAKQHNMDYRDLRTQTKFFIHELNSPQFKKAKQSLENAKTIEEATKNFYLNFESMGRTDDSLEKRIKYAKSIDPSYSKNYDDSNIDPSYSLNNDENIDPAYSKSFWYDKVDIGKNNSGLKDNTFAVLSILKQKFPDLKVTSTLRNSSQSIGKNSKTSRHNVGEAFDISHTNKNVYDYLNSYEGLNLLNRYGLGVLDETNPETMKKTGATGPHFHIGADSTLVSTTRNKLSSFKGVDVNKDETNPYTPYTSEFSDVSANELLSSFNSLKESIDKKNEQDYIKQKNEELRNNLIKKQQERDFLLAQALSVNLPFVERKY